MEIEKNLAPLYDMSEEELDNVTPFDLFKTENYINKEIRDGRYNICLECNKLIRRIRACKECKCFMASKTWLKDATCPIGKW